jgi:hypothetical protein
LKEGEIQMTWNILAASSCEGRLADAALRPDSSEAINNAMRTPCTTARDNRYPKLTYMTFGQVSVGESSPSRIYLAASQERPLFMSQIKSDTRALSSKLNLGFGNTARFFYGVPENGGFVAHKACIRRDVW